MPQQASNSLFARQLDSSSGYQTIYSFAESGKSNDGDRPLANLVEVSGLLYGTTQIGGTTNAACALGCGTVYRVSTSGEERVIYRFKGRSDGAGPVAGLIVLNGALVGTTSGGGTGSACTGGCGTVFEVSTDGKSEEVLHSFTGGKDGADPVAGLTAIGGVLYGTTQYGGRVRHLCSSGCGTVFRVSSSGAESVLYRFTGGRDGAYPVAALLVQSGELYGTTQYGGVPTSFCETGCGTIFKLSTAGRKTMIYNFKYTTSSGDGAFPAAALIAMSGELYGTTIGGGEYGDGSVFEADASSGAESVLHSFECCMTVKDGLYPIAPLRAVKGVLYGTTYKGGTSNRGIVFVVTTSGAESIPHEFTGKPDGAAPQAGLIFANGALYGTTTDGGTVSEGTVFKLLP
jgi:uncharacterized repeat protein (TIGR03803 family)